MNRYERIGEQYRTMGGSHAQRAAVLAELNDCTPADITTLLEILGIERTTAKADKHLKITELHERASA